MGRHALDVDAIWAAGYLDGEGHFGVYPPNRARIEAVSVNPLSIRKLVAIFGGSTDVREAREENNRRAFRWRIYGDGAREAARRVLPYLVLKGPEAEAIVATGKYRAGSEMLRAAIERAAKFRKYEYDEL